MARSQESCFGGSNGLIPLSLPSSFSSTERGNPLRSLMISCICVMTIGRANGHGFSMTEHAENLRRSHIHDLLAHLGSGTWKQKGYSRDQLMNVIVFFKYPALFKKIYSETMGWV